MRESKLKNLRAYIDEDPDKAGLASMTNQQVANYLNSGDKSFVPGALTPIELWNLTNRAEYRALAHDRAARWEQFGFSDAPAMARDDDMLLTLIRGVFGPGSATESAIAAASKTRTRAEELSATQAFFAPVRRGEVQDARSI